MIRNDRRPIFISGRKILSTRQFPFRILAGIWCSVQIKRRWYYEFQFYQISIHEIHL